MRDGTSPQTTLRVIRTLIDVAEQEGVTHLPIALLRDALDQRQQKPQ